MHLRDNEQFGRPSSAINTILHQILGVKSCRFALEKFDGVSPKHMFNMVIGDEK